jgi:hypothetical protein
LHFDSGGTIHAVSAAFQRLKLVKLLGQNGVSDRSGLISEFDR